MNFIHIDLVKLIKNNLYKIIFFNYLIIITFLFLVPLDSELVLSFIEREKQPSNNTSFFIHFIIFFVLYFLIDLSFRNIVANILFCLLYSILIESLQLFTARGYQSLDIFYNIFGLISAILIRFIYFKFLK